MVDIDLNEQRALFDALQETLAQIIGPWAVDGASATCLAIVGGYVRLMDSKAKGNPCPECGAPIEKTSYLGGSCYLCSTCQT